MLDVGRRGRLFDSNLMRACDFSCGFMIDLTTHGFHADMGADAIGHSGLRGSPFGLFDPSSGLSVAAILNGLDPDDDSVERTRTEILAQLIG